MSSFDGANRIERVGHAFGCGTGVLIADENALILTTLRNEFQSRRFDVWLAADGDDAVDLYRQHWRAIDAVLLEVHLPGLDGPEALSALQEIEPAVAAFFMYGSLGFYTEADLRDRGAAALFRKPLRPRELADQVQMLLPSPAKDARTECRYYHAADNNGFESREHQVIPYTG